MSRRNCLALFSMALFAVVSTPVQAALIAEWLLDETDISLGTTVAVDTTGNWNGAYLDGSFFASGTATSVSGYDGTPNSAVHFNKDAFIEINNPGVYAVPDDPSSAIIQKGGILPKVPGQDWMVDLWVKFDQNPAPPQTLWSESLPGNAGPTMQLQFFATHLLFNFDCPGKPLVDPEVEPPGGYETNIWYYVAAVYKAAEPGLDANGDPDENGANILAPGTEYLYVYDGTTVFQDQVDAPFSHIDTPVGIQYLGTNDRFRFPGTSLGDRPNSAALDNVTIYDTAFDPNSFLVNDLGIPEPASLTVLGFGGLLLAKRRQRV